MTISEKQFTTTTKEETPCIYAILNKDNRRVYVGETKTPIRRMQQHKIGLKSGTHPNKAMQEDFNKGNRFVFYRLMSCAEDDVETMRYNELKYMEICRRNGFLLYNNESDKQIKKLLRYNSSAWEMHCLMERKRDEYYKKYFGATSYCQFLSYYRMAERKGDSSYWEYKIKWFMEK